MKTGWKNIISSVSLPESYASVKIPMNAKFWKKMMIYIGPGLMVAVGYMDPGNWATNIHNPQTTEEPLIKPSSAFFFGDHTK